MFKYNNDYSFLNKKTTPTHELVNLLEHYGDRVKHVLN
jgi:hypothetical protein